MEESTVLRSIRRRSATSFGIDSLTHGFKLMQHVNVKLDPTKHSPGQD